MLTLERTQHFLQQFGRLRIGLVGDLFLDRYLELVHGEQEVSIETGLEAYQIARVRNSPGALGTVMNNLAALGAGRLVPVTVIGDDGHGYDLLRGFSALPIDNQHIIQDVERLTPTYTKPLRPMGDAWRELNRLDVRTREPIRDQTRSEMLSRIKKVFHETDGLIVLDQISETECGVVGAQVRELLTEISSADPRKLIFIDSRAHLHQFHCGILKGNRAEVLAAAEAHSPLKIQDSTLKTQEAAVVLAQHTGQTAFVTMGEAGTLAAQSDKTVLHAPAVAVSGSIDIVGAGDSATSAIVCSLLCGAGDMEAAFLGNLAASITIQQLGTTGTATPKQIRERVIENKRQGV